MSIEHGDKFLERVVNRHVLVIGDPMLDRYVDGDVTRVSPEDPTCLVLRHKPPVVRKLGGAANVACNIAALGASVDLVGLGGDRKFKDQFMATFKAMAEQLPGQMRCHLTDGSRCFPVKTRYCAHGKQLLRVDYEECRVPSADEAAQLKQLYTQVIEQTDGPAPNIAILSDYGKGTLLDGCGFGGASGWFLDWLVGGRLFHDKLDYVVDPKRDALEDYQQALAICPNQAEWVSACASGHKPLATHVVVTQGAKGCTLMPWLNGKRLATGCCHDFPVEPAEITDSTGAGDTFVAALSLALACDLKIDTACEIANAAARRTVMHKGTAAVLLEELGKDL